MPPRSRKTKNSNRTVAAINMPNLSPQTPIAPPSTSNIIINQNDSNNSINQNYIPFINVQNFDGNNISVNYFINQIKDVADLNKWNEKVSLLYAKSKLTGKAQTLITQAEEIRKFNSIEELFEKLNDFFKGKSFAENINEFESFQMLPQETIINLAHRLDLTTHRIYGDVQDTTTVNKTKFIKFLQIIPPEMRSSILENEINTYEDAVKRATLIQNSINSNKVLKCNNDDEDKFGNLTQQINSLHESVEKIQKYKQNQNYQNRNSFKKIRAHNLHNRNKTNFGNVKQNFRPTARRNFRRGRFISRPNHNNQDNVKCQLCFSWGHSARQCNQFQQPNQNVSNTNNFPAIPFHPNNHPN